MTDLRKLYQEVILDHNENPRNFGALEDANCEAHGDNPLCGDQYVVSARLEDETVDEVAFSGEGCAISKAAASMMTQHVAELSREEAEELIEQFRAMLTGDLDLEEDDHDLGHLKVFESVASRPERIKCAVLPWHTLLAAMEGKDEISTEGENDLEDEVE
jgi:nitrogen fixation NifU-like protein